MILQSGRIWFGGQFIQAQIETEGTKIKRLFAYNEKTPDLNFGDLRVVPGFIDIHTHGAYGFDTNDADSEGLRNWARRLPEEGVTAFLPTTITQSEEILTTALRNVAAVASEDRIGAEILGVHFEGPYLSVTYKGAHPEKYIAKPSVEQFRKYQEAADGRIALITVAAEEDEDFALTRYCSQNGVAVSIGHSGADYGRAMLAIGNGAVSMTHTHNAMTAYNHRAPGLVGAALRLRDAFSEVICDCIHVEPAPLNNLFTAKGRDYVIMISDSMRAKGGRPGTRCIFGGNSVEIYEDGSPHLEDGTLAGSTLRINEGLRNLIERALVPFDAALNSCTLNPARLLRIDNRKGRLCSGYDADITVLNDDYSVNSTYCGGKLSFKAD